MENSTEKQTSTTSSTFRRVSVIVALVLFTLATSVFLSRVVLEYTTPRVVAFDMKKTLDSFMDSVSQKQLTEAQSKALSERFNSALEQSLEDYQQQHHVVILVSPAVVQGAPDVTRTIQTDIARRMKGGRE
ncbi:type-F conjugative transfer system protein TrbI [Raoultella ornithinolytica]|uniref:type-F conjugative transfer system protein TrbI n=1 Tax=Klebsiella/Raoultella group TaxID=2890311 RepID=UPI00133025DC|nr:type-F conjugative transfer system protein TrbI [Klebsiella pneumoniae]EKQ8001186.1 type-F conjugative transfer system protein TrbI [Raoultella ornithinolytica]EKU0199837.1 type-F conjugative transfer system protein TrbI [Raoultella ornithinolytica]EKV0508830.1 type-F conjugative transfer system protein TrbI [Raoultella ornithinolytica]EKV4103666.1 type-F conjugative transfer system protein TrbI [Raoultella ornithinolytica]EKV8287787.1 type-F conjugative transfer system protein TrbI [Raoult